MSQPFANKAILVTGSTRGIGLAIARNLSLAGARVGIHGRTEESAHRVAGEIISGGGQAVPLACDLSDPSAAALLVRRFAEAAGRIDALVNNAGHGKAMAFRGLTLEKWQATFRLNLEAAMVASREAYVFMRQARQGAIVNIASIAGHGPGKWMGADYAASKAALVSLTKSLAFEAAPLGIRVNAVSPGFVETDMTAVLTPEMKASLRIPLSRLAAPSEVASVVAFLLSEQSSYITGDVLHVDGGLWM